MEQGFIFGGNTPWSYEDLQRKKAQAAQVAASLSNTPRNVGEGLHAIGKALMVRGLEKRASRREGELKSESQGIWDNVFKDYTGGSSAGFSPTASMPPSVSTTNMENQSVADDTMRALGKEPIGIPADVKAGIFAGESGGDYDAVFGYQQRPGGKFEGVKPTEMTVGEILQFQDPQGPYGQYVKGQVGRVATPVGGYQVVGTTLREAVKAGVVSPNEQFTPEVQDRVGGWIYKTQGTGAWEGYRGPGGGGGGVPGGQVAQNIAGVQAIAEAMGNPMIQQDPGKMAVLQALLGQALKEPETMTPYQQATLDLKRQELEADASGENTEYGLTPQFITTPDGNLQMVQLSKNGGPAKVVDLPENAALQKGVEKLDLGTSYQWYNNITGEPIGQPIPKNLREAEAEKAAGGVEGEAAAQGVLDAPKNIDRANDMLTVLDAVMEDPALRDVTGNVQGRLPAGLPWVTGGQAGKNVSVKIDQIAGKSFLEAFEALKGAGQITEREGQEAKNAQARQNTAQSTEEYLKALKELRDIVVRAKTRAEGRLGAAPAAAPPSFEAFAADPENQAAAEKYGVTLEEMFEIAQGQGQ